MELWCEGMLIHDFMNDFMDVYVQAAQTIALIDILGNYMHSKDLSLD